MRSKPRFRIVTGKGGVGKTVTATAFAWAEAHRGRRVLLAEMKGNDRVASLLGVEPVGTAMREVFPNLFVVDMSPQEAIHEYALIRFKLEAVYRAVFENRLMRRFLRLIPSLGELVMLGKLWYHEQEIVDGKPRFDVIVLDAPSTGHAIAALRSPAVVQRTVPPGPLRDITRDLCDLLTDPERTVLHVVTTPEEMPVNEAIELEQKAVISIGIAMGETIINQRLEPLPTEALERIAAKPHPPELDVIIDALRVRHVKQRAGEELLRRLPAYMLERSVTLPRLITPSFDRQSVRTLARHLEPALFAEEVEGG